MAVKYKIIADELRAQIKAGQYSAAEYLPTEFELGEEYHVSRQTVRQALSVLVNEGLIERRQGSGSRILRIGEPAQARQTNVAVVTTYISDYIFPTILREVESVFSQNGYTPLLFSTQNRVDNERKILLNLLKLPIDGILVEGCKTALPNPNQDLYQQFIDRGTPIVFIHGNYANLPSAFSVLDDNWTGGYMLVEYLHSKGHSTIAGIFKSDDIQGLQRYEGYISALRDLGLSMDDDHVFWYDTAAKDLLLNSTDALSKAEQALSGCTAVVCYNDEIASHLVSDLLRRGIQIPREMAVVSFDNSQYSEFSPIRITSLSHGERNVGRISAELMVRLIRGDRCHSEKALWVLEEKESS